jgi:hypothetical protein
LFPFAGQFHDCGARRAGRMRILLGHTLTRIKDVGFGRQDSG